MNMTNRQTATLETPFDLDNDDLYQQWRDTKLADYPQTLADLVVEINDPRKLTEAELASAIFVGCSDVLARSKRAQMDWAGSPAQCIFYLFSGQ